MPMASNSEGWSCGGSASPVTRAPSRHNHRHNQLPLNPVCPVTSTGQSRYAAVRNAGVMRRPARVRRAQCPVVALHDGSRAAWS